MAGNSSAPSSLEHMAARRRSLRSFQERPSGSEASDNEPIATTLEQQLPPPVAPRGRPPTFLRHSSRTQAGASSADSHVDQHAPATEQPSTPTEIHSLAETFLRGGAFRRRDITRDRRRGRDSAIASPSLGETSRRRGSCGNVGINYETLLDDHHLALAAEQELFGEGEEGEEEEAQDYRVDDLPAAWHATSWPVHTSPPRDRASTAHRPSFTFDYPGEDWEGYGAEFDNRFYRVPPRTGGAQSSVDDTAINSTSLNSFHRIMTGAMKRSRDKFECTNNKDIARTLDNKDAVAVMLYNSTTPNPQANDIWPECRSSAKLPAHYFMVDRSSPVPIESKSKRRSSRNRKKKAEPSKHLDGADEYLPDVPVGRPEWRLPVELVELIAGSLNRDDIQSLRLVSRELNYYVSQVIFKTVVVPFNTEIYGMLGPEPKPDFKGKKRAKIEQPGYSWKNANGDEVYNGHGLDVFRGFGKHILRYGMSFEVNEDSLATPPTKSLTEKKTSFWGNYYWPFEEYRRFDAVAGLETAADETPRMKTAFSELSRVKEIALSVDSGLGWLNGPDRSIRARILRRPPQVFGTSKDIPDRRAQAQQELWNHIQACHQRIGSDVRLATLYRMDGQRPLSELKETNRLAEEQPDMPYLDPHLIHEVTPHDTADIQLPTSFDDPEVLERFVLTPSSSTGVLFSSTIPPTDAGQLMSPIIPASLTKAQKEWLLETEWAQRAFMSSYMLSIIDNPATFNEVHTLNISRLSDRYLPMLNRSDFWDALPNLTNVTLMAIPGWRTVHKDEAGFVETPRINPTQGIDSFCDLLRDHVASRPMVRNLTVGWVTGGEHAEGLHARNKLLFPAPLIGLGVRADNGAAFASEMLVENDSNRLGESLLHFPYVQRLTLKNCWITPSALLQFVKIHDLLCLEHFVLDSVSLTAVLRPQANANQVGQQAAAPNPPIANFLGANAAFNALNNQAALQVQAQIPNQQQFLQIYIHTLQVQLQQLQANAGGVQQQNQITALQNQLQQLIQHLQNQGHQPLPPQAPAPGQAHQNQQAQPQLNFNVVANLANQVQQMQHQVVAAHPPPVPANAHPQASPESTLKVQPRAGSWMNVIDIISPGTNLSDFESEHSQADSDRSTSLRSIKFNSCGYAKLPYATFDQTAIEAPHGLAAALRNPIFAKRYNALAPAMLSAKWAHLGEIVQEVDPAELAALDAGWNLTTGWEDDEAAGAVEFDGALPGGTGRFTGIIRHSDRVVDSASANFDKLVGRLQQIGLRN